MKIFFLQILIFLHRLPIGRLFFRPTYSKTILIIKVDAIGDSVLWLDTAKEYRNCFPDHKIVLLYNKAWQDFALRLPYFDKCIAFDAKRFMKKPLYYFQLLKSLNRYGYQKIINPTYSRNFFIQDWIVHNVKGQEKIASVGSYQNTNNTIAKLTTHFDKYNAKLKTIADGWYTKLLPAQDGVLMELIRNAEFLRHLAKPSFQAQLPVFPFELPKTDKIPFEKYMVFCLGASTERKMWSVQKFAAIASKYSNKYGIVVCGGANESVLFEQFKSFLVKEDRLLNLCGKTTLVEMASILKHAVLTLTNDTAASHITVAVQTPSVCLLGGGHFQRFQPYQVECISEAEKRFLPTVVSAQMDCFGCNWICKYPLVNGKWKCVDNIAVASVEKAVEDFL